jgi:hypothetical protein
MVKFVSGIESKGPGGIACTCQSWYARTNEFCEVGKGGIRTCFHSSAVYPIEDLENNRNPICGEHDQLQLICPGLLSFLVRRPDNEFEAEILSTRMARQTEQLRNSGRFQE